MDGDPVMVNEDEDLLSVGKTALWRIGLAAGMTWSDELKNTHW